MMTSIQATAKTIALVLLTAVLLSNTSWAQFPTSQTSSKLAGHWKVTNMPNTSIQIQISASNEFRMLVDGKSSQGKLTSENNSVTLNFDNGVQQQFSVEREGNRMLFASSDGQQKFVMANVNAMGNSPEVESTGFPVSGTTETSGDTDSQVGNSRLDSNPPTSVRERVQGTWYAKLEDAQVEIYIKSEFRPDGTFRTSLIMVSGTNKETHKDEGRWSVRGNKLVSISEGDLEEEIVPIQFVGSDMVVDMTREFGTKMRMSRESSQVKPSALDLQRLIRYAQSQEDSVEADGYYGK